MATPRHRATRRLALRLLYLAVGVFVLAGTLSPLASVVSEGLLQPPRPIGFGQDNVTLWFLARASVSTAIVPSALAAALATCASCMGYFHPGFRRFYRRWIYSLLFTNPVFLVLGATVLASTLDPWIAVVLASWLVLMPLVALPIQSAIEQVDTTVLAAARALGSSSRTIVWRHLLPAIGPAILLGIGFASVYALGFYLLPTFVGYGQISTLGVSINTAFNRLGDAVGAAQLGVLLIGIELVVLACLAALAVAHAAFARASLRKVWGNPC